MTDWNKKNEIMSLAAGAEPMDTESMARSNTNQITAVGDTGAARCRQRMGLGDQAPLSDRGIQQHLTQDTVLGSSPKSFAVVVRPPRRKPLRRVWNWIREHPGYTSSPSQQTLEVVDQVTRGLRQ